jgi:glycosyltransferase involved in cell wall biosynthesis
MTPAVSVGIPVYNGERFLPATLDALRTQELTDIEIVISDNGSTDATETICRRAAAADKRIAYVRVEQNRGMGWNYNRVLELATAGLFMWNAADDVMLPSYLRRCVEGLQNNPETVLAATRVGVIDEAGLLKGSLPPIGPRGGDLRPAIRVRQFLDTEAWDVVYGVVRIDLLRQLGGMPHMVGDDVVLGVDLLLRGPICYLDEALFLRRYHAEQSSEQHDPSAGALQQDPDRRPWLTMPHWAINAELYRRVALAPLPTRDRLAAAGAVFLGWTAPKSRRLLGDIRRTGENIRRRANERNVSTPAHQSS